MKDAAAVQGRGIGLRADAAGGNHSEMDYVFEVAEIDSAGDAQAVNRHCMAEEAHSDTEAGRSGKEGAHSDREDRMTGHLDEAVAGIVEVVQKVEGWETAAACQEARMVTVVGDTEAGLVAAGMAGLVGHMVGGMRCSLLEVRRTALAAGHKPENQLAVAIIHVSLCR